MHNHARALSALNILDSGCDRETWVRVAMAAKAAELSLEEFTEWSKPASNFVSEKDCAQVWRSLTEGAVQAGTLFHMAYEAGWNDPLKYRDTQSKFQMAKVNSNPLPTETLQQKANQSALGIWENCELASDMHPYIVLKVGMENGLRVVRNDDSLVIAGQNVAGWLVVPVCSLSGVLRTLQFIPPGKGKKLNLPGASFDDGMFIVGDIATAKQIFIVEGIGQAWACWSAAGNAAVVCFGVGRMLAISEILRREYPKAQLILVSDRGKESQAASIAQKLVIMWVELPGEFFTNYDVNDYAREYGIEALKELLGKAKSPIIRYRLLTASDIISIPPIPSLVRGVLPANGLACVYGASGTGKSFLVLDLCASIVTGIEWFNYRVKQVPVVYAALEGEAGFMRRVKAWQIFHGDELPHSMRFIMQSFDLRNTNDVEELARAVIISGNAGGLLVIDTLNCAANGADENSSADMGQIIRAAKALQVQLGGLVMLIHHSGKDQAKGLRGHSSLFAALDSAIEVTRNDNCHEWRIAKSKDDGDGVTHSFRLEPVNIGTDEECINITSCIVKQDETMGKIRRVLPPKSGNQKIAWDVIAELLRKAGDIRPKDAPDSLPEGKPAVPVESAIDSIRERLVVVSKRKTERAEAALTGLHSKRLIRIDHGFLWLT